MPRPRKPVELTPQSEAPGSRDGVSASSTSQQTTFCRSIKSSIREWLKERKNRVLFDSAKRIRYRWFLEDPDGEICETKAERAVKFNERYDALSHFVLATVSYIAGHSRLGNPKGWSSRRIAHSIVILGILHAEIYLIL